ncbi:MAG TPA: PQQ-binding-like beta-propeller repeat protein [Vicinamibacterales bacterium]|nr:PQQ-binding-like beta-propeller repeat protein [Vicinamibacterales bacterium]
MNRNTLSAALWFGLGLCLFVAVTHAQAPAAGQAGAQAPATQAPPPPGGGRGFTPGTESGFATFQTRCTSCHGNPAVERAPSPNAIREMTPERIYDSLTTGSMQTQSSGLTDAQKKALAEFMAGRPLGSAREGDGKSMPNQCTSNPTLANPAEGRGWNGWGNGLSNTRFQTAGAAGLTAAQVPRLKLKWAFGFPTGVSANAQPAVVAGRVFVGSDNGFFYSLDAKTGCVYWSFQQGSIVRNSPTVGAVTGQDAARYAVFFGDGHANVYALDAQTGRQLWKTKVDPHFVARITAGITYYNGKVFVPVSSSEEFSSGHPDYPCCTARGSVVALDASTGKEIWKSWVVPEEPKPYRTMPNGVVLYKPAGGAVWNAPTVDPARNAIYVGTGDATTAPPAKTTDAIMAIDINTGKLLWSYQATENDVFMGGCNGPTKSEACPAPMGPDMDIGNSPILTTLPNGKRALLAGTKSADVFALDPDNNGAVLFRMNAAGGPTGGGRGGRGTIVWGGAADAQHVYYGAGAAGLAAIRPATGERAWVFQPEGRGVALGAAPTVIPGVVFQGGSNGRLYAVSAADGKQLWEFDTSQEFETVNRMVAHGGAISTSGAVIVDGMVYVGSGYAVGTGATAGNVLLAFGID